MIDEILAVSYQQSCIGWLKKVISDQHLNSYLCFASESKHKNIENNYHRIGCFTWGKISTFIYEI